MFKTPQNDALMADAIAVHMKANGVKTMGYIGFADAYGDGWLAEIKRSAQTAGIKIVAEEKYNRNDRVGDGPGAEARRRQSRRDPDRRRGHAGRDAAEGARRAQLQGQDLPDARRRAIPTSCASSARTATARCCRSGRCWCTSSCPTRTRSRRSRPSTSRKYEAKYGKSRTTFGGHAWDAYLLLAQGDPRGAEEGQAGHEGVPRGAARRARDVQRRRHARRVRDERRTTTTASTTARA